MGTIRVKVEVGKAVVDGGTRCLVCHINDESCMKGFEELFQKVSDSKWRDVAASLTAGQFSCVTTSWLIDRTIFFVKTHPINANEPSGSDVAQYRDVLRELFMSLQNPPSPPSVSMTALGAGVKAGFI